MAELKRGQSPVERAAQTLLSRAEPMSPGDFWAEIANLGWAIRRHAAQPCGEELARRLSPDRLASMHARFRQLDVQLARAIEFWAMQSEETMPLPPDLQAELRAHIIALGELSFEEAHKGPWRAQQRAERDDYLEGFADSFAVAYAQYPLELLESLGR